YGSINCDFFPNRWETSDENYDDGAWCELDESGQLLLREPLINHDREAIYSFERTIVTSVRVLNSVKFHGFTGHIHISNENGRAKKRIPVTTTSTTWTTPGEHGIIYCDFFPEPSEEDEGNYGDGWCEIDGDRKGELLLRETVITRDGESYFNQGYNFGNKVITRVNVLNFGRFHGATNAINIINEGGTGSVYQQILPQNQRLLLMETMVQLTVTFSPNHLKRMRKIMVMVGVNSTASKKVNYYYET
ncbi:uncharacterized protein BDFB_001418, partial [Asbolus verrucosus]